MIIEREEKTSRNLSGHSKSDFFPFWKRSPWP